MAVFHQSVDLTSHKVDAGQQADRAEALIFMIAGDGCMHAGLRRQVRGGTLLLFATTQFSSLGLPGRKPSGNAINSTPRSRRLRALRTSQSTATIGHDAPLVPGDDVGEREAVKMALTNAIEDLKARPATLMPSPPESEDGEARLWRDPYCRNIGEVTGQSIRGIEPDFLGPNSTRRQSTFRCAFDFLIGRQHDLDLLCS
jgi:hypothetical protein